MRIRSVLRHRRWPALAAALTIAQAVAASGPPLPARIDPAAMGAPSFAEDFRTLDAGTDQVRPARPHRWRTVHGYGGPASAANRALSRTTLAVDRDFAGAGGGRALGLDPFAAGPDGLTISAWKVAPDLANRLFGRAWAGGLLTTKFSFAQKHGYFEAEMDLPTCVKGAWPAFWLAPTTLGWPRHGEIDAPETVGTGKIYWSTISGETGRKTETHSITDGDCHRGWHRYGVLWRPDLIGFYYDRRLIGQTRTPSDYSEPMYILLNLAVGGAWPGEPDAATTRIRMSVRQVRAWPLARR